MRTTYDIVFGGQRVALNADRTLWWPDGRTLFATDLHAGKAEHMRLHGIAIPGGGLSSDLSGLTKTALRCGAERLIFLGDLFHSEPNSEWDIFAKWCLAQPFAVELVRGNHDRFLTDEQLLAAGMIIHTEPYKLGPFDLRHHPVDKVADRLTLAGHVHPVRRTYGVGRDRLRSPCFWLRNNQMVLPAYGSFTGGYDITGMPADAVYVCSADRSAIIKC